MRESRLRASGRTFLAAVAVALSVGVLAGACASSENGSDGPTTTAPGAAKAAVVSDEKPVVGGKLVYGLYSETNGWNPATNQWSASGLEVTAAIFDTLTAYDENSVIKPFLAESFDHNDAFTEWTFKLRDGVKLHNGKPANAEVVVRNQKYLAGSAVTGPAYEYAGFTDISVVDDLTFKVTLSKPYANYPITFATQLGVVADPDWLESNDSLQPIGTGPFSFESWTIGDQVSVKKNPDYWQTDADGTQLPYLDEIEYKVIVDDGVRAKALRDGDIDAFQTYSGELLQDLEGSKSDIQVLTDTTSEPRETMVQLNTLAAPFTDLNARLALAYATDKTAYNEKVHAGFLEVADGPFESTSPWYAESGYPQYDPDKARELVDEVKAANGGEFAFTFVGNDDAETRVGAEELQRQWADVGITVTIELLPAQTRIIKVISGDYQASMWNHFDAQNPYADGVWWDPDLSVAPPALTLNFSRINDPEIGAALDTGMGSPDETVQHDQMAIVQQRLGADAPYIWLVHLRIAQVANERVVNLTHWYLPDGSLGLAQSQGAHPVAQIWMKP